MRAVWDAAFDAKMANPPYDTFSEINPPRHIVAGWNFGEGQPSAQEVPDRFRIGCVRFSPVRFRSGWGYESISLTLDRLNQTRLCNIISQRLPKLPYRRIDRALTL